MPHPIMFDEADPLLARVRSLALAFPGAAEKISHGRPFFHTKTAFAVYGGSAKPGGTPVSAVGDRQAGTRGAPRIARGAIHLSARLPGPGGWVGYDLDRDDVDWDEIGELLDMSFRVTAPATLVRELDASAP